MKVKNITLVITDPCYIKNSYSVTRYINESTLYGDWSCMCYKGNKDEAKKKSKEWENFYLDFFDKYYFSGFNKEEKKKLYEDYKNKKKEFIDINCYGEFCADSGQVAVYDYSTLSEEDQKWINKKPWCACIIPDYTGEFHYMVEKEGEYPSAHIIGDTFYTAQSGF